MGFKCGIVGLPNVGKSTVFNALTNAQAAAANYPFCTIDPNVGMVSVPDQRLQKIADLINPQQILPAVVEFVDIAGLVKGAAQGDGLGNKFLAHIRDTQAIAQVVRCFTNDQIIHVNGQVDPLADIETINTELILADLDTLEKAQIRISKAAKSGDSEAVAQLAILQELRTMLNQGEPARKFPIGNAAAWLASLHLLTAKPMFYLANVSEQDLTGGIIGEQVRDLALKEGAPMVAVCASIEAELAELNFEDQQIFLADLGLSEPGLNRVIRAGYDLLGLQTFFTAGVKEVRAWTTRKGVKAPQAAGVIHGDFERGFICAEVTSYSDYIQCRGEQGAREAGKLRLEGRDYIMQDGDVVHFRFNV